MSFGTLALIRLGYRKGRLLMNISCHTSVLQIPLYKLLYLDKICAEPLTPKEINQMQRDYSGEKVRQIIEGLEWAAQNPQYPYSSLLPGIPYSDKECHQYLMN